MTEHEMYYDQDLNVVKYDSWEEAINEAEQQLGMDASESEIEALAGEIIRQANEQDMADWEEQ
jgi:hypothetical protein